MKQLLCYMVCAALGGACFGVQGFLIGLLVGCFLSGPVFPYDDK